ncbi:MAG: CBS domain-containing protein [Desulfobacter sp.]|nr:MAG: CBS domain-containing protein [Desulfobacter sp.]
MPIYRERSVLSGMTVASAMQKSVVSTGPDTPVDRCVRMMIKSKADAVLVAGAGGDALGVVSKTDVMGAFYAGLPVDIRAGDMMMGPVQTCGPEEKIHRVLDRMKRRSIHQVFVKDAGSGETIGKLEYSDIVGLLYRYCRNCAKSRRRPREIESLRLPRLNVASVMTTGIDVCREDDSLYAVMDLLSQGNIKAVPVVDRADAALGLISKTDLVLAYARGVSPDRPAREMMNAPLISCGPEEQLARAILKMFFADIGHLFVAAGESGKIVGVLSLSDAARFRSGTCRACSAGRLV